MPFGSLGEPVGEVGVGVASVGVEIEAFAIAIDKCLNEALVLRDGLVDVSVWSDVADGPLTETSAGESKDVGAGLGGERGESVLDFIVGEESDVGGMSDREELPVAKDGAPGLEESREDVELEVGDVAVAGQIDRRPQSEGLERRIERMNLTQRPS